MWSKVFFCRHAVLQVSLIQTTAGRQPASSMRDNAAGTNGCLDLSLGGPCLRGRDITACSICCSRVMALRAVFRVAPARRSSGGWISAKTGRQSTGVGRRHPVTVRIASFRHVSTKWVWALLHHTGAQYSAGANTSARAAMRRVEAFAPHFVPASRLMRR